MSDHETERLEGWTWLHNSPKWHYFRKGRSLCGRWGLFLVGEPMDPEDKDSPDNCKACWRKRQAEKK